MGVTFISPAERLSLLDLEDLSAWFPLERCLKYGLFEEARLYNKCNQANAVLDSTLLWGIGRVANGARFCKLGLLQMAIFFPAGGVSSPCGRRGH